ncbi:MAG: serine/threonine protein kinase [Bacteroidia bacterium]|nr:serine/threonine protein kinase [Bacteroidota bacterium]MBP6412081.1 serine/threonine protein kinase [Bacteroidia bacterium]
MDILKAANLSGKLIGSELNGYEVLELLNNGKSAAVFKARKDNSFFALKVFDNELIERFGHEIQTKRIEQEISLENHVIENLVKIYEGGHSMIGDQRFYFIVMELVIGMNLKDYIRTVTYKQDFILKVLEKLTLITEQLLTQRGIVHRDIKPENIMVSDNGNIILMDLGVLKLIGAKSFSDEEEKSFVGTLRYAAPEFLLRNEENTEKGWRAINIYQIGATLHDLIMKQELFENKVPYANLVIAIKDDLPRISNTEISFELLQLTRDMMTKDSKKRLELVSRERIDSVLKSHEIAENPFELNVEEVLKMQMVHRSTFDEIQKLKRSKEELRKKKRELGDKLATVIENCFQTIKTKNVFTTLSKSDTFWFDGERNALDDFYIQNYLYIIGGGLEKGFLRNLHIWIRFANNDENYTEIELCGIYPDSFARDYRSNPKNLFEDVFKEAASYHTKKFNDVFKTINIFKGILELDESFNNHICTQIVKLIIKALKMTEKSVKEELSRQKNSIGSNQSLSLRVVTGKQSIIVDSLLD